MSEFPNEIKNLILKNLPANDLKSVNKYYSNYKFMKPEEGGAEYFKMILYCFPDLVHLNFVNNNPDLIVFNIGDKVDNFNMDMDTYDNLETWWISLYPNPKTGEMFLYSYQTRPKLVMGSVCYDDMIATVRLDYRVVKVLMGRHAQFGEWGDDLKYHQIYNTWDKKYTDEENKKYFELLKSF